jgi:polysaccharide export outer membrane protein
MNCHIRPLLAVWLGLLAFAADGAEEAAPKQGPAAQTYLLQPGDILQVSVWREQELQSEVVIRPDGNLSFPLSGEVQAAGRGVDEVRGDLEARLRKFVPEAVVTVAVKVLAGNRVFIVGKVLKAGDFVMGRPIDVMQAIALAGGATPFADLGGIRILRRTAGKLISIPFSYGEVESGRKLEQNILLQGGDTVVVP